MTHTPEIVDVSQVSCLQCGYNLTGAVIGGKCPECGARIEDSLTPSAQPRTSATAITSLVLGILGVLLCGLVAPIAIVLGVMGLREAQRGECAPPSRGLAIAGLVLGVVGTLVTIGGLAMILIGTSF